MFGRVRMKKSLEQSTIKPTAVNTNAITLDSPYGGIGNGNSVRLTTYHDNGLVEHKIIGAEVNEKRH